MTGKYVNLRFEIVKELVYQFGWMLFMAGLWIIEILVGITDRTLMGTVFMISIIFSFFRSNKRYTEYNTFGFCRKTYYKKQLIVCVISSMMPAFARTVYKTYYYQDYVKMYIDPASETMAMYHRIPVIEAFLMNFCIFMFMNLVRLIDNTTVRKLLEDTEGCSLQKKLRMKKMKKGTRILLRVITEIIVLFMSIVWLIGINDIDNMLMMGTILCHIKIFAIVIVADIGLYFIGRKRYVPRYI